MWEKKRDLDRKKICNVKTANKGHNKPFKKARDKRIKVDERISSELASYLQLQQLVKVSDSLIRLSPPPTAQIQTAGWGQGPGALRWSALGRGEQRNAGLKASPLHTGTNCTQQFTLAETLRDVSILIIWAHPMPLSPWVKARILSSSVCAW